MGLKEVSSGNESNCRPLIKGFVQYPGFLPGVFSGRGGGQNRLFCKFLLLCKFFIVLNQISAGISEGRADCFRWHPSVPCGRKPVSALISADSPQNKMDKNAKLKSDLGDHQYPPPEKRT